MALLAIPAGAQPQKYSIEPSRSKMEVHVYREGAFKIFGHDHLIQANKIGGAVHLDRAHLEYSSVSLRIETKSLEVADPGASAKDRRDVQAVMESEKMLGIAQHPEIAFTSTKVTPLKDAGGERELRLNGELRLHGVSKSIELPLRLRIEGDQLRVRGETTLLQTDFKITPVRIAAGTVRVKDQVKITFDLFAVK